MNTAIRELEHDRQTTVLRFSQASGTVLTNDLMIKRDSLEGPDASIRTLKDALRSAAYANWLTLSYQWRGQDTLTLGSQLPWIWATLAPKVFEPHPAPYALAVVARLQEVVEDVQWSWLGSLFQMRRPEQVRSYLRVNRGSNEFLVECYTALKQHFDAQAEYVLELVHDPENDDDRLFVYVRTTLPVDYAIRCLDEFDNDWFLKQNSDLMGRIGVNLEFA